MTSIGRIHSLESCGTVDGPGIRFVVFMQGCPLRCQYCHNPDTWKLSDGKEITVDELVNEVTKYQSYMRFSGGGITMTGGEPLQQASFVRDVLKACKEEGIHTAIDTSGFIFNDTVKEVLNYTDLVLLDIKNYDPKRYKEITGVELEPTLKFMTYLGEINKPTWVRYVFVPGLSDNFDSIEQLATFLKPYKNVEKIELLPFHKMGEYKWEELGYKYQLKDTKEPSKEAILKAKALFESKGLKVLTNE